jgi:hypothetical protein
MTARTETRSRPIFSLTTLHFLCLFLRDGTIFHILLTANPIFSIAVNIRHQNTHLIHE